MSRTLRVILCLSMILGLGVIQNAHAQTAKQKALWEDFNHYILIAKPDLAQSLGKQLLKMDDQKLLDLVEASDYTDFEKTLFRAQKIKSISKLAKSIAQKLQKAQIARSRNPQRIAADIKKLAQGRRANLNATQRLQAAGQFAAPALLAILRDDSQKTMHPYVMAVMVGIGRPLVYPLSIALETLEPVQQGQVIRILAEIGYPRSLPYIKAVMENPQTDPASRKIAETAFAHLAAKAGVPQSAAASELFLKLAQSYYDTATHHQTLPGLDPSTGKGIVWKFTHEDGLLSIPVPGKVYPYILAMRASRKALQLDPHLAPALSLWLASNLTRENKMPKGASDPSYPRQWLNAAYYLKNAGPLRQHDVLQQALKDHDHVLALDAIAALQATAGTDALVNQSGTIQPLIAALSYPDRRVRFHAALTLANARPKESFIGSFRIVPILVEAIRQTDSTFAVILADDPQDANRLAGILRETLGYKTAAGQTLADVTDAISRTPGVDVILTQNSIQRTVELDHLRNDNYKLVSAPMLAMASNSAELAELNTIFKDKTTVFPLLMTRDSNQMKKILRKTIKAYAGDPIGAVEAAQFANAALDNLWEMTLGDNKVFRVSEAQPALIAALGDPRPAVVTKTAKILAMFNSKQAQRKIADAALETNRSTKVRVSLLGSLAVSATRQGNRLTRRQIDQIFTLVKNSKGQLAQAASRVHGALSLPSADVVRMIAP